MATVVSIALRVVIAGALVAAFALLGDKLNPKNFAGIFSGALGLVAFAITGALLVDRIGVVVSLLCALIAWLVVSLGAYAVAARGRLHHAHRG